MSKSFYDFFMSRQRSILSEKLDGTASPEEHEIAGEHRLIHHKQEIIAKVRHQALADSSDPFTAARTMKNFKLGIAQLDDYNAEPHVAEFDTINFLTGDTCKMRETDWRNRRIPTI